MARRSGGQIGIIIAATALGEVLDWESEDSSVDVDSTAAGDAVMDNTNLRKTFSIKGSCLLTIAAPYVAPTSLVGTKVAVKLKIIAADTSGFVECTSALVKRFTIGGAHDGMMKYSFELGPAGVALTYNLTPA